MFAIYLLFAATSCFFNFVFELIFESSSICILLYLSLSFYFSTPFNYVQVSSLARSFGHHARFSAS